MNHDYSIGNQDAARAAGLDVAPSPTELAAMAERIVRTWGDRSADPDDLVSSTADTGAQLARAMPLVLAELDRVRTERDAWSDWADTLAYKVAPVEVLGTHENGQLPWSDALDMLTPAAEVDKLRAELDRVRAERDAFADRVDTLTAVAKSNKRHVQEMHADLLEVKRERDEMKKHLDR